MNESTDDNPDQSMIGLSRKNNQNQLVDANSCLGEPERGDFPSIEISVDEQQLRLLLSRIVDRDEIAFSRLYQQLIQRVYGLALRITRCVETAEEVTEDTFWQVWRQAPRFDVERGNALVWVMTIARSRALDALRRVNTKEIQADEEQPEPVSFETPQDLLTTVQNGSALHQALAQLEPQPRQLLALAYFRGLSHDEIADYTGIPLGTVKSLIRRTLLSLKQTLADDANLIVNI